MNNTIKISGKEDGINEDMHSKKKSVISKH